MYTIIYILTSYKCQECFKEHQVNVIIIKVILWTALAIPCSHKSKYLIKVLVHIREWLSKVMKNDHVCICKSFQRSKILVVNATIDEFWIEFVLLQLS